MKIQILELREAGEDGGDIMGWYAKGHHDPAAFSEAVKDYCGIDSYSDFRTCQPQKVLQDWWRTVPMRGQSGCTMFVSGKEGERGAFAVTVFEYSNYYAGTSFEKEKEFREQGRDTGQREAANFAYNWILSVKGEKSAEEYLAAWNGNRNISK